MKLKYFRRFIWGCKKLRSVSLALKAWELAEKHNTTYEFSVNLLCAYKVLNTRCPKSALRDGEKMRLYEAL